MKTEIVRPPETSLNSWQTTLPHILGHKNLLVIPSNLILHRCLFTNSVEKGHSAPKLFIKYLWLCGTARRLTRYSDWPLAKLPMDRTSSPGSFKNYQFTMSPKETLWPNHSPTYAYRGCLPWMLAVDAYRGCLPWMLAVDAYRGCLPWMLTVDAYRGCLPREYGGRSVKLTTHLRLVRGRGRGNLAVHIHFTYIFMAQSLIS
jgi:hypothetical protein